MSSKSFLVVLSCNLCGMLSPLLIGGRYFESSCDIFLQFSLVTKRKTESTRSVNFIMILMRMLTRELCNVR